MTPDILFVVCSKTLSKGNNYNLSFHYQSTQIVVRGNWCVFVTVIDYHLGFSWYFHTTCD